MIEVANYSHAYATERDGESQLMEALRGIALTVAKGEFVSLVGPSGCGKTTLLNVLGGLEAAQGGDVRIDGTAPGAGRTDIAYMFARPALFPWLSVERNVTLGMEVRQVEAGERAIRARRFIEAVELDGFEHAYPGQLSQGMRQRVALARTFSLDSPVLLMDEPFGALDAQTKLVLQDVLNALLAEGERKTVVFVTHDLGEAIALADRVVVFSSRPGTIVRDYRVPLGRPRVVQDLQGQTIYHEIYADLWQSLAAAKSPARQATA